MRAKTTLFLLLVVVLLGGFIWFVERDSHTTEERDTLSRRAVRIDPGEVDYFRLETKDRVVEVERVEEQWHIRRPVEARADTGEIDRMLNRLRDLEKGEIITENDLSERGLTLADYGLARPRARFTMGMPSGRSTYLIGRDAPLGEFVYVRKESAREIVSASKGILSLVPEDIKELRDHVLFQQRATKIARIDIQRGEGFIKLVRDEQDRWELREAVNVRADRRVVTGLLDALVDLRVHEFIADQVSDMAAYGLDETAIRVSLWPPGEGTPETLALGKVYEKDEGFVYAALDGVPSVVLIAKDILGRLGMPPDQFRDRRLLALDADAIDGIQVEAGDQSLEIQKIADGRWQVVRPVVWETDTERVARLLEPWTKPSILFFRGEPGTIAEADVFKASARRIRLSTRNEDNQLVEVAVVHLGAVPTEAGHLLVRADPEELYAELDAEVANGVSVEPLFYRDRVILSLKSDDVRTISVVNNGRTQTVERNKAGEFVVPGDNPLEARFDSIAAVLATLARLTVQDYVLGEVGDLAAYGLDVPRANIELELSAEAGIGKFILLGNVAPSGGAYAMIRGQDVIFILDQSVKDNLLQPLYEERPISEDAGDAGATSSP